MSQEGIIYKLTYESYIMRNFGSGVVEICSWNKPLSLKMIGMSLSDVSTIRHKK